MNPIYGDMAIAEELGNIEGKVTVYNGGASAVVQRAPEAARGGMMQHPNHPLKIHSQVILYNHAGSG